MVANVLFYIAIIVTVNVLSVRINNCLKDLAKRNEIDELLAKELRELIKNIK
jgi:hypothetical protein